MLSGSGELRKGGRGRIRTSKVLDSSECGASS